MGGKTSHQDNSQNKLYKYQEFYIIKDTKTYIFKIEIIKDEILIKCENYSLLLNNKSLFLLTKLKFNSIYKSFNLIINIFKNKNVFIQEVNNNDSIKLFLKIDKKNNFEIILLYSENNNNKDKINNNLDSNIIEVVNNSYSRWRFDNTFCVFKSINNMLYLIYANKQMSIISYDLFNNKKINEIKKAHAKFISNFRHYFDIMNRRDLILSISCENCNIKIWNINNMECLLNLENVNSFQYLNSACFLNDDNQSYILSTNCNWSGTCDPIKIFDINGNKIKEINNSNDNTLFIDIYYDNKFSKKYILTANNNNVKSYDYNKNIIYHIYDDNNSYDVCHRSIIIYESNNIIKLVESSQDGLIRVWDFHSGTLLKTINIYMKEI